MPYIYLMKNLAALLLTLFACLNGALAQISYPDAGLPTDTPKLFAPGLLTDGLSNRDLTMSPAGDELFFTIQHPKFIASVIVRVDKVNGVWGKPEVAPFSGINRDLEAAFSPDGKTLYFSSDRPLADKKPKRDFDIWKVSKTAGGQWGVPENLGAVVNSTKSEFYPSVAKNGNLYFTVEAAYGKGSEDIVLCRYTPKGYEAPISLPEDINTKFDEFNAFVDPDEQFILFTCQGRADDMGKGDLYLARKNAAGNWQPAQHLPAGINSTSLDYCPYITPDKKYLIFTSNRLSKGWYDDKAVDYKTLKALLSEAGNGLDDEYWVKWGW
ncbi:PD40 domain-containing protein [Mucilaginibacter sp. ZT4R22]|uniref:PD40 domain-containing protein n=1 Tax=Mucilaginibacter pankratovii TaxID=2772110 RepID=A0ABR7WKQ0_9SPHI|nr:PD40 domain-containing protein [Mucilaginibacter pankratovii]MBD1362885.1 PD40 domain-containing protein [Mucilaginibacter pankratovii]